MALILFFPAPDQDSAYQIGITILRNLQQILSGPRSGRWYPLPGNMAYDRMSPKEVRASNYHVKFTGAASRDEIIGAAYQASAPGEPPAQRTGRLRQSFYLTVDPDPEGDRFLANIRTNVYYADDLELGTEKIDPRPFMGPAIEKSLPTIQKIYEDFSYRVVGELK